MNTFQSAEDMRRQLTEKAMEDPAFREQFVADPKGVLYQEFGVAIPDNIEIKVHESDMHTVHMALPPSSVLDEEQLQAVSAGLCCCGI